MRRQAYLDNQTTDAFDVNGGAAAEGNPLPSVPATPMGGTGDSSSTDPNQNAAPSVIPPDPNAITTPTPGADPTAALAPVDPNAAAAPPPAPSGPRPQPFIDRTAQPPSTPPLPNPDRGPITGPGNGATTATPPPPAINPAVIGNNWASVDATGQTLKQMLEQGVDPQAAIDAINAQGGGGAGEFEYYPGTNVIGAPGYYIANNNGVWNVITRTPEGATTPPPANGPTTPAGPPSTFAPGSLTPAQLQSMGAMLGGPGDVGSDPFSREITGGLGNLIQNNGMTPEQSSVYSTLSDLIAKGGETPAADAIVQQQEESARENEAAAYTGELNQANADLASRGLVSQPGVPQGEQGNSIARITTGLAPSYSGAVRDISTAALQAQNDRLTSALSDVTGLTSTAAGNLLNALGQGTQRQIGLAQIALQTLQTNVGWNEFLANYGLTRDQILYQIQQGNTGALGTLLNLFTSSGGVAGGGTI